LIVAARSSAALERTFRTKPRWPLGPFMPAASPAVVPAVVNDAAPGLQSSPAGTAFACANSSGTIARPKPMHPQAVIFDIDGTLIDSVDLHARAWQETFASYGIEATFEEVRSQIGKGGDQLLPVFLTKDAIERIGKKLEEDRTAYFHERYLPEVRPFPRVRELFERLRSDGIKIALASSAKKSEVEYYKRIGHIVGLSEIDTCSDDAERSKPHPDIFLIALQKLGSPPPTQVVSVGDTPYDAEAARKAGIIPIGVLSGGFPETGLHAAGCVNIYRDPADILAQYDSGSLRN
jgi:HAD superfamily hydrolase (TIGR01509 family)